MSNIDELRPASVPEAHSWLVDMSEPIDDVITGRDVRRLALTVVYQYEAIQRHEEEQQSLSEKCKRQDEQIERVRKALHRIEQADEQAQHDWDTKANMYAQGSAMGYSMAAQWLEEALGDTNDH